MRVFKANLASDNDTVVEVNARVQSKEIKQQELQMKKFKKTAKGGAVGGVVPRKRSLDPRFEQIYGEVNPNHVNERYAFLKDMAAEENSDRLDRMKKLRQAKRALAEEDDGDEDDEDEGVAGGYDEAFTSDPVLRKIGEKVNRKKASASWGSYDDDFGGDEGSDEEGKTNGAAGRDKEVDEIVKNQSLGEVQDEIRTLQTQVAKHKQAVSQQKANDRLRQVKAKLMKKEVDAVKSGEKKQPYFLKRKEVKKEVEKERFQELEKRGGKKMVEAFAEKKAKKAKKHILS